MTDGIHWTALFEQESIKFLSLNLDAGLSIIALSSDINADRRTHKIPHQTCNTQTLSSRVPARSGDSAVRESGGTSSTAVETVQWRCYLGHKETLVLIQA